MTEGVWEAQWFYRVRRPDGTTYLESRSHAEVLSVSERTGWPMERLWERSESEWRLEPGP